MATRKSRKTWMESRRICQVTSCSAIPGSELYVGVNYHPFLHYLWASFVFMLPACIAYVVFGSSMGALLLKGNIKGLIIGIIVASIAMLLPFCLKASC